MDIESKYQHITNPPKFVTLFKDDNEFSEWCKQGSVKDLYCTLEEFKQHELYEHCLIISNTIKEKCRTAKSMQ